MVVTDALCVLAAFTLAHALRFATGAGEPPQLVVAALATPTWILILSGHGLYRPGRFAASEELRRVFYSVTLGASLVIMASFWSGLAFSRAWIGLSWAFALALILVTRRLWHRWMFLSRQKGRLVLRTVLVGDNDKATEIAAALRSDTNGYVPFGYLATGGTRDRERMNGLKRLGAIADVVQVVRNYHIECLYVTSSAISTGEARSLLRAARAAGIEIRMSMQLTDVLASRISIQPIGGVLAANVAPARLTGYQVALKRTFDLVLAGLLSIVLAPVWIAVAIAVRLDSRGPVLFRQHRVTKGGRVFTMYKFRTMRRDADAILDARGIDPTVPFFKIRDDPRLTRAGRLIRRLSLDEIPQLINVLKGDMSLVGPRPLPADQVAANLELLESRHEVLAGVTGWTQTGGRSELDAEEQLRLDHLYIENWSLSLDVYLRWKTLGAVLA